MFPEVTIEIALSSRELRNDAASFVALARLHADLSQHSGQTVHLDWSEVQWFDAHLSAPLRTIVLHGQARGNSFRLAGLRRSVRDILSKNGLLKRKLPDVHRTTMPVQGFALDDSKGFAQYTKKNLSRPEMPRMTPQLQRKLHEGIDELFANSSMHSDSPLKVVVAGQFYPLKHLLTMSISDGGIGIVGSLRKSGLAMRNHSEAIEWAMETNNTSKRGDIPGGLGLAVLREFIAANNGKLLVASKRGFWCQRGRSVEKSSMELEFPGTAVILEINTADKKAYDLNSRLKATDIW